MKVNINIVKKELGLLRKVFRKEDIQN